MSEFKTFIVTPTHLDEYTWQMRDRNFFRCNEIAHNLTAMHEAFLNADNIIKAQQEVIKRKDALLERAMYTIEKYKDHTMSPNQWDLCDSWLKDYEELKK